MLLLLKKLIKVLRGGAGGREIMLGLTLGIILGMTPGLNLFLAIILFLVLLLNANVTVVLLGLLFGKLACVALAPITFEIGFKMIHGMGLEGVVETISKTPVLAWLGVDRYCLIGGLPIGIVAGLVIGTLFAKFVTKIRATLVKAKTDNETFKAVLSKWYVKLIVRVFAGKTKADMEETLEKESPLFRKSGIIVAVTGVVLLLAIEMIALNFGARIGLEKGMGHVNGAEVNLASADVSIFGGVIDLKGLQVTDADAPEKNAFQASRLTADFSVKELLRKRLVIEVVAVDGLDMDQARKTPGKVYEASETKKERDARKKEEEDAEKDGGTLEGAANKIADVIDNWEKYERYVNKAKDLVERALAARRAKKKIMGAGGPKEKLKYLKQLAKQRGYLALSANEWSTEPLIEIRRIQSGGHAIAKILPEQAFVLTNLSTAPERVSEPMTLAMEDVSGNETFGVSITLTDDMKPIYDVRAALADVQLSEAGLSGNLGDVVKSGLASAKGGGLFQNGTLELPFALNVKDLQVEPKPGEKVLGMNADTAKQVFAALGSIDLEGKVVGSLNSLNASVDMDKLQKGLGDALLKSGKEMLANRVNEEYDKAKKQAKAKADKVIDKEVDKVKDEIRAKYGDEISDKIGAENYKKAEAVLDKADSDTLMKGAKSLGGLLGGDDAKETPKDAKKEDRSIGEKTADGAGKLFGGIAGALDKKDDDKKKDDADKKKDDADKKKDKKKKSLLDLLN